jgi:serine protease AprX
MRVLRRKSFTTGLSLLLLAALVPVGGARRASAQHDSFAGKISPDLLALTRRGVNSSDASPNVSVVVQFSTPATSIIDTLLSNIGGRLTRRFKKLNARVVTLPLAAVNALAERDEVKYVSPVRAASASGHVTTTTGADAVRLQKSLSLLGLTTYTKLDGSGVGIAVIDSGVDADHAALAGPFGLSRVTYSQDFTGEGRTDDAYGHGTHVASIAAGTDQISGGAYAGLAPNANVINLRVLNSQGQGTTS